MATVSSLNTQSSVYSLVQQYMSLEQTTSNRLQTQKTELQQRRSVVTDLGTQLRALRSAAYNLQWKGVTNPINTFKTTSGDSTVVIATASGSATDASHVITVKSLAKAHSIASAEFSGGEVAPLAGEHRFHIVQKGETYAISVTVAEDATYGDVLSAVAAAINDSGARVTASVATTNALSGERRLLLTSQETGTQALIAEIGDDSGELARALGFDGKADADRGYGRSTVQEATDAQFTIDGLEFVSSSNRAAGVLTGLTLDLAAVSDGPVTVTVERDIDAVKQQVQAFLDAHNKLMAYVREKTKGADESGAGRGAYASDSLFTTLRSQLRTTATADVPAVTGQASLVRLAQMGITADREGKLSISDLSAFTDALVGRPGEVERLFVDQENGLAVRLVSVLDQYTKAGGLLDQQTSIMRSRERAINDRVAREQARLERREQQLTTQLANLQVMAQQLSQQQQIIEALSGYTG